MKKNKIFRTFPFLLTAIIILSMIITPTVTVSADQSQHSLIGDFFNKTLGVELNNGSFLNPYHDIQKREKINLAIYKGTAKKKYSLYDRFGPDIKFVPYYGEVELKTKLIDKVYSKLIAGDLSKINVSTIIDILTKSSTQSNNKMYHNRPPVLSSNDLGDSGLIDPRVSVWENPFINGTDAEIGNVLLNISKTLVSITSLLTGPKVFDEINNLWTDVWKSGISKYVKKVFIAIVPALGIIFLAIMVSFIIKFVKGRKSIKEVLIYTITGIFTLGLCTFLVSSPNKLTSVAGIVVHLTDQAFSDATNSKADNVVKSDDKSNIQEAAMWEKVVFKPWVKGNWNGSYKNLYAIGTKGKSSSDLNMSNDNLNGTWGKHTVRSNTPKTVGSPTVPLGHGKTENNWAAFEWSTQSLYHTDLDSIAKKDVREQNLSDAAGTWPKAKTTPLNNNIYLDDFRWIDAKMNVSYGYKYNADTSNRVQGYEKSHPYYQAFTKYGFQSFFLAILIIPILCEGFYKMKFGVIVVFGGIQLLVRSLTWFFKPNNGFDLLSNLKKYVLNVGYFLWYSILVFTMISVYTALPTNMAANIMWIFISWYLFSLKTPNDIINIHEKFKTYKRNFDNRQSVKEFKNYMHEQRDRNIAIRQEALDAQRGQKKNLRQYNKDVKRLRKEYNKEKYRD